MPTYTYCCDNCGEKYDYDYTWEEVDAGAVVAKHYCFECGKELRRDYSGIRMNADQGKFDPKSSNFWKKGKSAEEVSRVLTGEAPMP